MYCWRCALLLVAMAAAFEGFGDLDDAAALLFARSIFVVFVALFLAATLGTSARRIGQRLRRSGYAGYALRRRRLS